MAIHLSGHLTLPPRRLDSTALPMGVHRYLDPGTARANPPHPARRSMETRFVRRFAEQELLFFQLGRAREPVPEELVVVLDQGVLTWGTVRLRAGCRGDGGWDVQAAGTKFPFAIAATSREGSALDPRQLDVAELGALLEASDLSADPGRALARATRAASMRSRLRDVVLLTHPRTLRDPNVLAAAHEVDPLTRLFAVSVDADGHVALSDFSRGRP